MEIEPEIKKLKISFADLLIGTSILLFCIAWVVMREPSAPVEKKIIIYKDELVIIEVPINIDKRMSLESHGVHMVVEIKDNKIRVVSSDCLQQICVKKSWAWLVHDSIICMPNHIFISIEGDGPEYDVLSH